MSRPDWQDQVQSKAREVGRGVRDFAQSGRVQQVRAKLKAHWLGLGWRGRLLIVGVGTLCLFMAVYLLFGGKATQSGGGQTDRSRARSGNSPVAPSGSYVQKALKFREEHGNPYTQAVPNDPPGSRWDFLHAMQLLGFSIDKLEYRHDDGFPARRASGRLSKQDWEQVFGAPDWLSDDSSSVGTSSIPYRRWRHQCTDGILRFHGNLSRDMQVNVILFE